MNSKAWIQTYSGGVLHLLDPQPEEILIEDIAHSLAMQCRFTGHTKWHYCPAMNHRILTSDLQWIAAGDLKAGQGLLAFDEYPHELGAAAKKRRRFRPAHVVANIPIKQPMIRLELSDGNTLKTAANHPWLVATKQSRNQKWLTAQEISNDLIFGHKRYMHQFVDVWHQNTAKSAGWLAGIFDGEGSLAISGRRGIQLAVAQNSGLVLNQIMLLGQAFGYQLSSPHKNSNHSQVNSIQVLGGWSEILKFLGEIRPLRLLDKFEKHLLTGGFDKQFDGKNEPLQICRSWNESEEWVSGLETTTHTYLCEGYAAHNSVAQHSVLASQIVKPGFELEALLHDASEAYAADLNRPLKHYTEMGKHYMVIEDIIQSAIARKFGVPEHMSSEVKAADNAMLYAEKNALMPPMEWDTRWGDGIVANIAIEPWTPAEAEGRFLRRYAELREIIG